MEMSIARALVELKTLGNRIEKLITDFEPIDIVINGKLTSGKSKEDFCNDVKASAQQINDLIVYRDKIKSAIVMANATTTVTINNTEMSVAQAIEKKTSIGYSKMYLEYMRQLLAKTRKTIEQTNQKAQERLDKLLETTFSKDSTKVKSDELESVAKPFMSRNEATMLDPAGIEKIIAELDNLIVNFEQEVDIILSESNARTMILLT